MGMLDQAPVFIVGAQRSGTTWLQRMLASHPLIVSGQESHLFSGYLAPLWQRWEREQAERVRGRTIGLACYLTEKEWVEELRRIARRVFARLERAKAGVRLLVEKTPDHGLHLRLIQRVFPDAIILHIVRDGRDVAASMREASRHPWGESWAPASVEEAARRWVEWVKEIQGDLAAFPRTRTIRYEDLEGEGTKVLADLFQFLGVPLPPHQVKAIHQRCQFSADKVRAVDSLVLEGDCKGMAAAEPEGFLRRGKSGAWETDLSPQEQAAVHAIAGDLLHQVGYKPTPAANDGNAADRFISTAERGDMLWAQPKRLGVLQATNAQMLHRERLYLYATILALAPERCLEVGVSQGGSTRIIHAALRDLGRGVLIAMDPAPKLTYAPELLQDAVTFLRGGSPSALAEARALAGGLFDFVLLDGDHSFEGVRADLEGLITVTRPGALVLAHDAYFPAVAAAIDAGLQSGLPFSDAGIVSTTRHPGRIGKEQVEFAGFRLLVRTGQAPAANAVAA